MSAATTNVSIRVDKDIKSQADALFAEFGLNFTTAVNIFLRQTLAVNIFLRQTLREGKIPFTISLNKEPNKTTLEALKEIEEMEKNPSAYKSYKNVDEMMEELLK